MQASVTTWVMDAITSGWFERRLVRPRRRPRGNWKYTNNTRRAHLCAAASEDPLSESAPASCAPTIECVHSNDIDRGIRGLDDERNRQAGVGHRARMQLAAVADGAAGLFGRRTEVRLRARLSVALGGVHLAQRRNRPARVGRRAANGWTRQGRPRLQEDVPATARDGRPVRHVATADADGRGDRISRLADRTGFADDARALADARRIAVPLRDQDARRCLLRAARTAGDREFVARMARVAADGGPAVIAASPIFGSRA